MPAARSRVTVVALLGLLAIPWSVQVFSGRDATLLFAWGLVNTSPPMVTTLPEFLFLYTRGLPAYILAWPLSVGLYATAVASVGIRWWTGGEDRRVTAGVLVVAAVAQAQLAWGFSLQPSRVAWPVGSVALVAVAAVYYWVHARTPGKGDDGR
ncbi:hypothetical protein GCM10008995_13060 [Halobellus salinus]|uniref:DUF8050 domain-containing protein n=1 Tax=Halobellus salinus TaxID=931585 RepID=A0A830E9X2_9EURY|nr:TIGR04206 family protein [Halobellus salinus]GGJ04607.1 hypothetical protein GCM10008995_13060 [Halobellus salinus]SMP09126.1 TIGR04206 family protein [Halobellus salinus]